MNPAGAAHAQRVQALCHAFEQIAQTRMAGLAVLHAGLKVQALGFVPAQGGADGQVVLEGILITPWFMNLVRLPAALQALPAPPWLASGCSERRSLGCERFDFLGACEDRVGAFEVCSLFSPMFEFAHQEAAVATATEIMALLRAKPTQAAQRSVAQPSRRGFMLGRRASVGA